MATDMRNDASAEPSPVSAQESHVADLVRVRIPEAAYTRFRDHLVREEAHEHAGYLVAGVHRYAIRHAGGQQDVLEYLVQEATCLGMDEYAEQGARNVTLSHNTLRDSMFEAATDDRYLEDRAILIAHSHPFHENPSYSSLDDESEPMAFVALTAEGEGPHASLLFGTGDTVTGRVWPNDVATIRGHDPDVTDPIDEVVVVGDDKLRRIRTTASRIGASTGDETMYDRQALVHGGDGNSALHDSHVAVVGAGGLGSLIIQSLAHLGVGNLTVVDPDVVEETNRSRIVGSRPPDAGPAYATPEDVTPGAWAGTDDEIGRPKVEVMQRMVANIDPTIRFHGVSTGVEEETGIEAVLKADVIVSATDTASSRVALSHAAKQYHRPLFDAGTNIDIRDDIAKYIATRLSVVTPSTPCLDCQGEINWNRVTAEHKDLDELEYGMDLIEGEAPAVITINQKAAARVSFAVHRYLTGLLAGRGGFETGVNELITGFHEDSSAESDPTCKFCGDGAFAGMGERGPSPAKPQELNTPAGTGLLSEVGVEATPEYQYASPQVDPSSSDQQSNVTRIRDWLTGFLP